VGETEVTGLSDGAALLALLAALLGLALVLAHDRDTSQPIRHLRRLIFPPPPRRGCAKGLGKVRWKGKEAEESLAAALKVTRLRCRWRGGCPLESVADTCLRRRERPNPSPGRPPVFIRLLVRPDPVLARVRNCLQNRFRKFHQN
jgi:hypothetical protein